MRNTHSIECVRLIVIVISSSQLSLDFIMSDTTIRLRDNGPLVVEGPIKIIDAEGNAYTLSADKPAIALCRCGATQNRPFCDGSHKGCNFEAADRVNG